VREKAHNDLGVQHVRYLINGISGSTFTGECQ